MDGSGMLRPAYLAAVSSLEGSAARGSVGACRQGGAHLLTCLTDWLARLGLATHPKDGRPQCSGLRDDNKALLTC